MSAPSWLASVDSPDQRAVLLRASTLCLDNPKVIMIIHIAWLQFLKNYVNKEINFWMNVKHNGHHFMGYSTVWMTIDVSSSNAKSCKGWIRNMRAWIVKGFSFFCNWGYNSYILRYTSNISVTIFCSPAEVLQHDVIVAAAEHPSLHQAELFPSGQLPLTGETGETGQVVHAAPSSSHPVTGVHLPATLGTLCAKPTVRKKIKWRFGCSKQTLGCTGRGQNNVIITASQIYESIHVAVHITVELILQLSFDCFRH